MPYVFIVNFVEGPQGPGAMPVNSAYFSISDESAAYDFFKTQKAGAGEDGLYIELVRLDVTTLESVIEESWQGTCEDLDDEGDRDEDGGFDESLVDGEYEEQ